MKTIAALVLAALIVGIAPTLVAADAFKCKGQNGEVVFSDQPCKNGEAIPLREVQTYNSGTRNSGSEGGDRQKVAPPPRPSRPPSKVAIHITNPAEGAILRDNDGNVSIAVAVAPELPAGYKILVTMDGSPLGPPSEQTSWQLDNVDRGEHHLSASVEDDTGKIIETSPASSFNLFRTMTDKNDDPNKLSPTDYKDPYKNHSTLPPPVLPPPPVHH